MKAQLKTRLMLATTLCAMSVTGLAHAQSNTDKSSQINQQEQNASGGLRAEAGATGTMGSSGSAAAENEVQNERALDATSPASGTVALNAGVTISSLPKEGAVSISGEVAKVDDKREFTLKDAKGDTITVKSKSDITVQEGAKVSVNGEIQNKMLGLSKSIAADSVTLVN